MLGYPFHADEILRGKRALKKQLKARDGLLPKKIALLSGSTIGDLKGILELFLLDNGIDPTFFEGEYGKFYEDVVFDDGSLAAFAPDVIYIHTSVHDLREMPAAGAPADVCDTALDAAFARYSTVWQAAEKYGCPVIQDNFEYPAVRPMGSYDAVAPSGKVRFVRRLNERMADYAETHSSFYVHDLNYLAARHGLDAFADPTYYNAYKYSVSPSFVPYLAHSVANIVKSLFGKSKKALMLDLDNTLWKGVIGDDGVEGIRLGIELPEGIAHSDLQAYAKELAGIGIILGVCSKNEDAAARSGFTHPATILKADDFLTFKANWDPKPLNLQASAAELNVGVDSFVFADDNPAEREIVRAANLGVAVPELTSPETYARTIADAGYFEVTSLSADDLKRTEMYRQNAERAQQQASFEDYGEYLRSLEMHGYLSSFTEGALERITQLANKTNQFNLTTRRYTEDEMRARMTDPDVVTISGRLVDKFGDNGLVTEIIANRAGDALDIELWIMSCRVFKRELEEAMFDELVRRAKELGITRITGSYYKTQKNVIVAEFYGTLGFRCVKKNGDDSVWEYEIPENYQNKNKSIEVHT